MSAPASIRATVFASGPHAGRSILHDEDGFVLVELKTRRSESSPTRIKCVLGIPYVNPEDPKQGAVIPMPFAQPIFANEDTEPNGFTPEFRIELN